ncbi:MAG: hypothetical protein H0X18_01590 [Geodermatophilaceae bacterium]|nr:hypothetical protein [Geodermatophilaceae bacterium]
MSKGTRHIGGQIRRTGIVVIGRLVAVAVVRALLNVGGLAVGCTTVSALLSGTHIVELVTPARVAPAMLPAPTLLDRLVDPYECSHTGFGPDGPVPMHALVRTPGDHLRVVSFAYGWDVHTSDAPGVLLAVCLR